MNKYYTKKTQRVFGKGTLKKSDENTLFYRKEDIEQASGLCKHCGCPLDFEEQYLCSYWCREKYFEALCDKNEKKAENKPQKSRQKLSTGRSKKTCN